MLLVVVDGWWGRDAGRKVGICSLPKYVWSHRCPPCKDLDGHGVGMQASPCHLRQKIVGLSHPHSDLWVRSRTLAQRTEYSQCSCAEELRSRTLSVACVQSSHFYYPVVLLSFRMVSTATGIYQWISKMLFSVLSLCRHKGAASPLWTAALQNERVPSGHNWRPAQDCHSSTWLTSIYINT